MPAAPIIAQVILELLNISLQALKSAQIIGKAQAEGRDITNQELDALDKEREELVKKWQDAIANHRALNP